MNGYSCCPDSWPDRPLGKEPEEGSAGLVSNTADSPSVILRAWQRMAEPPLPVPALPGLGAYPGYYFTPASSDQNERTEKKIKSTFPKGQEETERVKGIGRAQFVPTFGRKLGAGFVCLTVFRIVLCVGLHLLESPRLYGHLQRFKTGHFNVPIRHLAIVIQYKVVIQWMFYHRFSTLIYVFS